MPFFDGVTGRVYYRHWPSESPRAAVVFLHGFGEHGGLYHRYAAALNAAGIDLLAPDEIGHGLTEGERGQFGSLEQLAENADRLIDAAAPDAPLVIAGHSLGSIAALFSAFAAPDRYRGAVISGAPLTPLPWLTAEADEDFDLDPVALSADPFYLDALANDPLAFTSANVGELLAAAFPPAWQRLSGELPGLRIPLLAVHGAEDPVSPIDGVRSWVDRMPNLRLVEFPGAGHDILNEVAHREVAATVVDFVNSLV